MPDTTPQERPVPAIPPAHWQQWEAGLRAPDVKGFRPLVLWLEKYNDRIMRQLRGSVLWLSPFLTFNCLPCQGCPNL